MAFDAVQDAGRSLAVCAPAPPPAAEALAHDLNNLLSVILAANEAIARDLPEGSEGRELAELSQSAAQKGAVLLRRLLDCGAGEAGGRVEAGAALAQAARLARPAARGRRVETSGAHGDCRCETDPVALERALLNLCVNAAHATPRGGRITLGAETVEVAGAEAAALGLAPGGYVRLWVRDTGAGMSPDVLARAAEPYFTTRKRRGGTGLGLAGARAFAEAAGGALALVSELGRGTTASLYLPRAAGPD